MARGVVPPEFAQPDPDAVAAALERVERFECPDERLDYGMDDRDRLVWKLDTRRDDEAIVAEWGDWLAERAGIHDRQKLLAWVTLVRPELLKQLAYELNQAAASMGASDDYIVVGGKVDREFYVHLDREAAFASRRRRFAGVVPAGFLRIHDRGRAPRSRRATVQSSSARSPDRPGRPADDDPDLAHVARRRGRVSVPGGRL
jgi:hypothetical protein